METPYTFHSAEELAGRRSCAQNRGAGGKPLFQLNHWVEKPPRSPSTAAKVNDFDFMVDRARRCEKVRDGALQNIVAVDYYDNGDVGTVTQVLNGLPPDVQPQYRTSD